MKCCLMINSSDIINTLYINIFSKILESVTFGWSGESHGLELPKSEGCGSTPTPPNLLWCKGKHELSSGNHDRNTAYK